MVNAFRKTGQLLLLLIPLLIFAYYIFGFGFGCGLGMGHDFDCRVLLPISLFILIGTAIVFVVLIISNFAFNEKINRIILIVYIIGLVLIISTLFFAANYKNLSKSTRLKYFEGQTLESCSSDSCLIEIFTADILADKEPPIVACEKIRDQETKKECLLRYDAFVNDNFYACLNITSNIGLGLSTQQVSPVVFERDYCYNKVAMQKENKYVHPSPYISIFANEPWKAYSSEMCAQETRIAAKNYCYYLIGRCSQIESAEIMQEDCRTFYTTYYLDHYEEN